MLLKFIMSYVTRGDFDAFRTEVRALVGDISREQLGDATSEMRSVIDAKFAEAKKALLTKVGSRASAAVPISKKVKDATAQYKPEHWQGDKVKIPRVRDCSPELGSLRESSARVELDHCGAERRISASR